MNKLRSDPLENDFKPVELCDKISSRLFWVIAFLTLTLIYYKNYIPTGYEDFFLNITTSLYVILVLINTIIFALNQFHFTPRAETKRCRELLSNAFDIRIEHEKTELYYNNNFSPSITRLGLNLYENTLFGKTICAKMAGSERIWVIVYCSLSIISVVWRHTDLGIISWLFQVVFSSEVIIRYLSIERARCRFEYLFDQFHSLFLGSDGGSRNNTYFTVTVLALFAEYETIKARSMFKQSTKIFKELNPALSKQWENILRIHKFEAPAPS